MKELGAVPPFWASKCKIKINAFNKHTYINENTVATVF